MSGILDYIPAQLHENKETYVSYYVKHPETKKFVRKKIRINRIKSAKERRKYGRKLVHELNIKLAEGWNPFLENEAEKSFHKLFDAMEVFLTHKKKELRHDSIRTYKSNLKTLSFWVEKNMGNEVYVISFTQRHAVNFMNYLYTEKNASERVWNNFKRFGVTFWNWLIENQYCKANVFHVVKKKIEREKTRIVIPPDVRRKIKDYLEEAKETEFLTVSLLTFYALLRPKEITYLRSEHIDLRTHTIRIPGEFAKTGKQRIVTIPPQLYGYLKDMNLENIPPDWFLFSEDFKPGAERKDPRLISKRWSKLREEIGLPVEMQFYSLKDSGIVQMLRDGISPEIVRDQAGHSSLEMTNKYINIAHSEAQNEILKKSSEF